MDVFNTILYNRCFQIRNLMHPIGSVYRDIYHPTEGWTLYRTYQKNLLAELGKTGRRYLKKTKFSPKMWSSFILTDDYITAPVLLERLIYFNNKLHIIENFLSKSVRIYKDKILSSGEFIARAKGATDIMCTIKYHPIHDHYFSAAFQGHFKGGMENGRFVFRCIKEGTTQQAVVNICLYKCNPREGKRQILEDLDHSILLGLEDLKKTIASYLVLSEKWFLPSLESLIMGYLQKYMDETLYLMDGSTSLQRLHYFVTRNPVLAEYIWVSNFNSEKTRKNLGSTLNISSKNMKAFTSSDSVSALHIYLEKKTDIRKSRLDALPKSYWDEIEKCQTELARAKKGVPVGRYGRYINSENIAIADARLKEAWRKADQWLSKNHM